MRTPSSLIRTCLGAQRRTKTAAVTAVIQIKCAVKTVNKGGTTRPRSLSWERGFFIIFRFLSIANTTKETGDCIWVRKINNSLKR